MADEVTEMAICDSSSNIKSILSSAKRDFLVLRNGYQVKIDSLSGKIIGLYFAASRCCSCLRFTSYLIDFYEEIFPEGDFEVVFVSADENEKSFRRCFSQMPWLAIPFSDLETRNRLDGLCKVSESPFLVILNSDGKVLTRNGIESVREYGIEGFPFTPEKILELKEQEKEAKKTQTLRFVLEYRSRDFLIKNDGEKVPVYELEGKVVALYFSLSTYYSCVEFTPKLVEAYEQLKERGESFEVVLLSLDEDEDSYKESFENMPWLALPFMDKRRDRLSRYFNLISLPTLVIIGPDGKTLNPNVAEVVEDHGSQAFPFTAEKLAELAEIDKAREEAQTLESILVSGKRDFVIAKDGSKIPVSQLVGKNILLYFSAEWCPPCQTFLHRLINAYREIKAKDEAFEVIFISSDHDEASFYGFFWRMPWLALPFGDERKKSLSHRFKVYDLPSVIAIGPTGRTVTKEARDLLMIHGVNAYPFTEERLKEIMAEVEETAKGWPKKLKHALHEEHELVLDCRWIYTCDGCKEDGYAWSFHCDKCGYDLHPKCAFEEAKGEKDYVNEGNDGPKQASKEGWTCDGELIYNA